MLNEILCDKFISNNIERGPISFHDGLNIVQGHNTGANSIGKSTFLLAIDFAFGGKTYAQDKKLINKIGDHLIKFTFKFDDKLYYFSRYTNKIKYVNICDENYEIIEEITLEKYNEILFELYKIELDKISFRKVVGLFFRIYGRDSADEKAALSSYKGEGQEEALVDFLNVFNRFSKIADDYDKIIQKKNEKSAYKTANDYHLVKLLSSKKDYEENLIKIEEYKLMLTNFNQTAKEEMEDMSTDELKLTANYSSQRESLYRKKRSLWTKYYSIKEISDKQKPITTQDFSSLQQFFPQCNIKLLSEIDAFHSKLTNILSEEFKNEMDKLLADINDIAIEIDRIEKIMAELDLPIKISKKTLEEYSEIKSKCIILENENKLYLTKKQIDDDLKIMKKSYETLFLEQSKILCEKLNLKIKELNDYIYGPEEETPFLNIKKVNSYTYGTEDDDGTGTNNKNMILLDLASLSLTDLPCVAHDTIIFKHIGQLPMAKILELYSMYEKQIFIAIDETIKYPENAQKTINDNTILQLSDNGNELFGYSWAKRTIEKVEKK